MADTKDEVAARAKAEKIIAWLAKANPEIDRLVRDAELALARGVRREDYALGSRLLNLRLEVYRRQRKLAKLRREFPEE